MPLSVNSFLMADAQEGGTKKKEFGVVGSAIASCLGGIGGCCGLMP